jgi:hypothetical protein
LNWHFEEPNYILSQSVVEPFALSPIYGYVLSWRPKMNTLEREQLSQFLQQLTQAHLDAKDSEADSLIRESCSRQPDAAYLLVQRTIVTEQALKNSQAQIARLQAELAQTRPAGRDSFLGDANSWGNSPVGVARAALQQPFAAAPLPAAVGQSGGGLGSGWLGNVATTAAGVVAGSFLFQGIEHMMGNHNSNWMSGGAGLQPPASLTENSVINNYYDGSGSVGGNDFDMAALDADLADDTSDVI